MLRIKYITPYKAYQYYHFIYSLDLYTPLEYSLIRGIKTMKDIKAIRNDTALTQRKFSEKYNIPIRTIQKWERNGSTPPEYVPELLEKVIFMEGTELFMECYWKDEKTASVRLDKHYAYITRYTKHPVKQIFYSDKITRFKFGEILEDRCWDKNRPDIKKILSLIGLTEYNPYEICKRTHGKMYQDSIWFRFPGEILTYEEVQHV